MRTTFINELNALHDQLTRLGVAANESVHKAMKAYNTNDKELAKELFSDDLRINALTVEIEKEAYRLIALQQPVAHDLRMIFTVLTASLNLERIADHAVSVARAVLRRSEQEIHIESLDETVNLMADIVQQMVTESTDAFVNQDTEAARRIADRDEEVDACLKKVYHETAKRMEKNAEVITTGISYINVANSLERIGDYVTNICERIVYLNTGEIVELNN